MKQSIETLKGYFENGDVPTQMQYEDLLDSLVHKDAFMQGIVTGYEPTAQVFSFEDFPSSFEFLNAETAVGGDNLFVLNISKGYVASINVSQTPITMSISRTDDVINTTLFIEYVVTKFINDSVGVVVRRYLIAVVTTGR